MTGEKDAPAGMPGVEEIAALRFSPASRVAMRITPDGRLVPGEGLSEDEATRGMFSSLQQMFASKANEMEARALAAEAENRELRMQMLADEGQAREPSCKTVDGTIDIRLDDKGGIDEIFGNGVLCHIERMDKGHWFVNMIRPDQTGEAFWLTGKGKVEFTMHEHRPAPTTGPNVEPWTIAAAIRAEGE